MEVRSCYCQVVASAVGSLPHLDVVEGGDGVAASVQRQQAAVAGQLLGQASQLVVREAQLVQRRAAPALGERRRRRGSDRGEGTSGLIQVMAGGPGYTAAVAHPAHPSRQPTHSLESATNFLDLVVAERQLFHQLQASPGQEAQARDAVVAQHQCVEAAALVQA